MDITHVSELSLDERKQFYIKVYNHIFAYLAGFAFVSWVLFSANVGYQILTYLNENPYLWLAIVGGFFLADKLGEFFIDLGADNPELTYLGPAASAIVYAVMFSPLFAWIAYYGPEDAIVHATIATIALVGGLTATIHISKVDLEPIGAMLKIGSILALAFILTSIIFGFQLSIVFSFAMLALAGAFVLYDTSRIVHEYTEDEYVRASLRLFTSILFFYYYVLQIFGDD